MNISVSTPRALILLAICAACAVGGLALAQHGQHPARGTVQVTELSQRDIIEKLDGKAAGATVIEVNFRPGEKDSSHRHAGPVFGYVIEGEYAHAIDDQPVRIYKAGETFYEPSGCIHRVAENASATMRTRLLAVILHPRGAQQVTIPEQGRADSTWSSKAWLS